MGWYVCVHMYMYMYIACAYVQVSNALTHTCNVFVGIMALISPSVWSKEDEIYNNRIKLKGIACIILTTSVPFVYRSCVCIRKSATCLCCLILLSSTSLMNPLYVQCTLNVEVLIRNASSG